MDFLQDYLPQLYYIYANYYAIYAPYINPLRQYILLSQSYFFRYFFPYLYPVYRILYSAIFKTLYDKPDFGTLALLAVTLLISLKILDVMRRTVIYWISVMVRFIMWGVMVAVGLYVWQRGVEQSLADAGWIIGLLMGLEEEGENIGARKAHAKAREANMPPRGPRGRTRGGGWA